jgi:hypothetical protein
VPQDVRRSHELYGMIALNAKQYDKAVEELKQSDLRSGYDLYYLALAYEGAGDHTKAVQQAMASAHINSILNLKDVVMRQKAVQLTENWAGK